MFLPGVPRARGSGVGHGGLFPGPDQSRTNPGEGQAPKAESEYPYPFVYRASVLSRAIGLRASAQQQKRFGSWKMTALSAQMTSNEQ